MNKQHILLTGATSGIGKQIAIYLSGQGAKLSLIGRSPERLSQVLGLLSGQGHSTYCVDLSAAEQVENLNSTLAERKEPYTGFVHCAGVQKTIPVKSFSYSTIESMFHTNLFSCMVLLKGLSKRGRFTPGGSVVFISSVAAANGMAANSMYAASKGGVEAFCRSAAMELAPKRIRVNSVAPGLVETEMAQEFNAQLSDEQKKHILAKHPLGLGSPEDIAYAVEFLLSDKSRWITGATLAVDGGYNAQ